MIGDNRKGFTLFEIVIVVSLFSLVVMIVMTIFSRASFSQRREAISQKALGDIRLIINTLSQEIRTQRIDYDFYKGFDVFTSAGNPDVNADCSTFTGDQCDLRNSVAVLALVDDSGQKTRYYFDAAAKKMLVCKNNPVVAPRNCNPAQTANYINITPASVLMNTMRFYISPIADPSVIGTTPSCDFAVNQHNDCVCTKDKIVATGKVCSSGTSGFCDSATKKCVSPQAQPTVTINLEVQGSGMAVGNVTIPLQFSVTSHIYDR